MAKRAGLGSLTGSADRASAVREGLLFAVAGLAPAVLAVGLGLRAVRNEEAAVRREAAAEIEGALRRAEASVLTTMRDAEARLAGLRPGEIPLAPEERRRLMKRIAPPFAEPAVLDARQEPVLDAPVAKQSPDASRELSCRASAEEVAKRGASARAELAGCDGARTEVGGWLVPFTLLGVLHERASDDDAELLIDWLGERGASMVRSEQIATREEIRSSKMTPEQQQRAVDALERGDASMSHVVTSLRTPAARGALARGTDLQGLVKWRADGALGALRLAPDGGAFGFVADATSLAPTIATRTADDAPTVLRVVTQEPAPSDSPRAIAWLGTNLGIEATLRGGNDLAARTRRARWGLWAVAGGSAAIALIFAFVLFARLRAARRTSELRTTFAAAVSHELRTPIASIRMLAELLEGDRAGDDEERRETASAIAKESRRLGDTVARFLAWSRMSAHEAQVTRRQMLLGEIVGDAIDVFEDRNPGFRVEREIDATLLIAVDAPLVQLAVMNLLENAKKYAPGGQPYRVTVARLGATRARIAVRDRGPGVPRAWRAKIFDAFERGDDRLSRATEGTGIGLALVRAIARAHGGDASIEVGDERGATFVIELRDDPSVPVRGQEEPSP